MKWIPITKEEDCPEKDSSEEYPKQYILRCKNDGGRGDYEVFKVTADEMWLTALGFDYFEYLDEQDEGWVPVAKRLPELTEPLMGYDDDNVRGVLIENFQIEVLAFAPEIGIFKARRTASGWSEIASHYNNGTVKPTHWRPLPTPPATKD